MKSFSDLVQILVLNGGLVGIFVCILILILAWQALKIVRVSLGFIITTMRRLLISFGKTKRQRWNAVTLLVLGALLLNAFRGTLVDQIQYIEQAYLHPAYLNSDTSVWALQMYENELKKHVGESEFEIVRQATRKTAHAIGSNPLAIYEVAYSECGMNPFCANVNERGDTVAYGWIQFTRAGCHGINFAGRPVTMRTVKDWGRERNVGAMMDATHQYLTSRAAGNALPTATDVYIAVFAPGMIGKSDDAVLYSARGEKPANYFENAGLDGYGLEGEKIIHARKYRDGKITVRDMRLHLALKKSKLF